MKSILHLLRDERHKYKTKYVLRDMVKLYKTNKVVD